MSRIIWDNVGERLYETGIQNGVLYLRDLKGEYPKGVAWNGLISITESPSGAEATPLFADNIKYLNLISTEEFGATIEAFTYPDEFMECDGSRELAEGVFIGQQTRLPFGLVYKTLIGNDVVGTDHGYKLHLVYNSIAAPSERANSTVNDSPEAVTFSWDVSTTPVPVPGFKPSSSIMIDSTKTDPDKLAALEAILFGSDGEGSGTGTPARLPMPAEILTIIGEIAQG